MSERRSRAVRTVARGRDSTREARRDAYDRFIASDPGLGRLRHGLRAVVAPASAALLLWLIGQLADLPARVTFIHMTAGGMVALNLATSLRETRRRTIALTAAVCGAAAVLGVVSAVLVNHPPVLVTLVLVLLTYVAVWMRRFGARWSTAGFVLWQAHFLGIFLRPPLGDLPGVIVAVLIGTGWTTLLLLTVLHADPEATLRRTVQALRAQARSVVSSCLDVLDRPQSLARRARLRDQVIKTNEVALLFDGQLADARALPEGVSAIALRRWIIDVEIGVDEVAGAVLDHVGRPPKAGATRRWGMRSGLTLRHGGRRPRPTDRALQERHTVRVMRRALRELGWGNHDQARAALAALREPAHWQHRPARRLVIGAELLLTRIEDWTSGRLLERARRAGADPGPGTDPDADTKSKVGTEGPGEGPAYEPVVTLFGGELPGSQDLAGAAVTTDTAHWWSAGRLKFSTRQAIQAACAVGLAMMAGGLVSSTRSYWAALAAYIVFTGASTTAETTRKAVERTIGTLLGLGISLLIAHLTTGRPALALVVMGVGVFLSFYVMALSVTWMICFLTVVLGQLYQLSQPAEDQVLWLRLGETAIGAVAGILVAYAVLPAPAGETLRTARRRVLDALAALLDHAGALAGTPDAGPEAATAYREIVELDEAARQLAATHDSLIRPRLFDADHAGRRHRIAVLVVCAATGRSLLQAILAAPRPLPPQIADVCGLLAAEARRLTTVPDLRDQRPARADRPGVSARVSAVLETAGEAPAPVLRRAQRLADALALLTPRRR